MASSLKAIMLGDPVDPEHKVVAQELYDYLTEQALIAGLSGTSYFRDTLADLSAVSGEAAGDLGVVLDDGTASNNGCYSTNGTTWTKVSDLPLGFSWVSAGEVDNSLLADMANGTIKGRTTAGTGAPEDMTVAQVRALLNIDEDISNLENRADRAADADMLRPSREGRRRYSAAPASIDQFGRQRGGFNSSGEMILSGLFAASEFPLTGRRRIGFPYPLVRQYGGSVALALSRTGSLLAAGMDMLSEFPLTGRRRSSDYPVLRDSKDRALISVRGGKIWVALHEDSFESMVPRLAQTALRGDQGSPEPMAISAAPDGMVAATVQEPLSGQVFDAAQIAAGATDLMLIQQASADMRVVWFYGQSNSGNYCDDTFPPIYTDVRWPHTVAMFAGGPVWNEASYPSGFLADLEQAYDPALDYGVGWHVGQSGCIGVANGVEYLARAAGGYTYGTVALSTMKGGERLENLQTGSAVYDNLLTAGAALPVAVGLYGRPGIGTVDWVLVQGESITVNDINGDPVDTSGTAQDSADAWYVLAEALLDDVTTDIPAQTGCDTLRKYVVQTNRAVEGAAESYANTQLQLALDRSDVVMPCSMTMCPLSDTIHPTPIGRLLFNDTIAHVISRIDAGEVWSPLRIDADNVTRDGAEITLPVIGGPSDGTLMQDTDWQPAVDGDGFVYDDDSSSASVSSVTYLNAPRRIVVTLDAPPTGANKVLQHAIVNTPLIPVSGATPGWPIGRTRAMVQTATPSPHAKFGAAVPEFERHYLLRQTVDIT